MSSNAITTITRMLESLPDDLQERIVAQVCEYVADLAAEDKWNDSFRRTQSTLAAVAHQAKQEIADGKSMPMDFDRL